MAIFIIILVIIFVAIIAAIVNPETDNTKSNYNSKKTNTYRKEEDDYFEDYIIFDMINKNRK